MERYVHGHELVTCNCSRLHHYHDHRYHACVLLKSARKADTRGWQTIMTATGACISGLHFMAFPSWIIGVPTCREPACAGGKCRNNGGELYRHKLSQLQRRERGWLRRSRCASSADCKVVHTRMLNSFQCLDCHPTHMHGATRLVAVATSGLGLAWRKAG